MTQSHVLQDAVTRDADGDLVVPRRPLDLAFTIHHCLSTRLVDVGLQARLDSFPLPQKPDHTPL